VILLAADLRCSVLLLSWFSTIKPISFLCSAKQARIVGTQREQTKVNEALAKSANYRSNTDLHSTPLTAFCSSLFGVL
jgi:hypothetical protein